MRQLPSTALMVSSEWEPQSARKMPRCTSRMNEAAWKPLTACQPDGTWRVCCRRGFRCTQWCRLLRRRLGNSRKLVCTNTSHRLFSSWRKHGRNPHWRSCRIWTTPSSCWVSSEGHWALGWCWIWTHCLTRTFIPDLHGRVPLWHVRRCGSLVSGFQVILADGLASADIFHAVTATEEHVRHGWHYLVPLVAVVGGTANTNSAVDDFVKWKRIKSLACVINSSERSDFLRLYVYLCHMSDILYLSF